MSDKERCVSLKNEFNFSTDRSAMQYERRNDEKSCYDRWYLL